MIPLISVLDEDTWSVSSWQHDTHWSHWHSHTRTASLSHTMHGRLRGEREGATPNSQNPLKTEEQGKTITFRTYYRGINCCDVARTECSHIIFVAACLIPKLVPFSYMKDKPKTIRSTTSRPKTAKQPPLSPLWYILWAVKKKIAKQTVTILANTGRYKGWKYTFLFFFWYETC